MKRYLKINGFLIAMSVVVVAVFPGFFLRPFFGHRWDVFMRISGIVFVLFGQLLRLSARGYKSENSSRGNVLIKTGPYAFVRHPMYLGVFLIGIGVMLAAFHWWGLGIFFALFATRYFLLLLHEEKRLFGAHSQTYVQYRMAVPGFLPLFSVVARRDIVEYLPVKGCWIKKELGAILVTFFLLFSLQMWHAMRQQALSLYAAQAVVFLPVFAAFVVIAAYLQKRTERGSRTSPHN